MQVILQKYRQHLMPKVKAVGQRRQPAQQPPCRGGQRQPQTETNHDRCSRNDQRHTVHKLKALVVCCRSLRVHQGIEPDKRRRAQCCAARAQQKMLCPAAARQPCKDERCRHADRQHPAERRELVEKQRVRIPAVLGQRPERVDKLHAAEHPQHRQRMPCAERCKQQENQIKQCKHRQRPADRIKLRTNVARREKLLGQRQMCEKVSRQ